MVSYTTIRLSLGLAAVIVFVFMLNGLPCLGDADETCARINSFRMFQDNRELLKSPQKINLGPSLVVPRLIASEAEKMDIWGIFPNSMFELVESVGRRHPPTEHSDGKRYIVRRGDTLWNIAAEKLGNPGRYKEISELNADVLKDENDLTVGMLLSLPAQ